MKESEYRDRFGDIEWDISVVNQYVVEVQFNDKNIRVPTRDCIVGPVAYLPRDEEFSLKTEARLILRFDSDYLPVSTPSAVIEEDSEGSVIILYSR